MHSREQRAEQSSQRRHGDGSTPRYPIDSVDKALQLLLLVRGREALSVAQAADELNVARSTAHRLLAMLHYHGFVEQDAVLKVYVPGPTLVGIGLATLRRVDLRRLSLQTVQALVEEIGETSHLVILRGSSVVFLDSVECRKAVRAGSRTGDVLPAHCTASGKALLAELDGESLSRVYADDALPTLTPRSLNSKSALLAELELVRHRGFAVNVEESEDRLTAVAAAVRDRHGHAVGAVTVAAPSFRLADERAVLQVGAAIQRHLNTLANRLL